MCISVVALFVLFRLLGFVLCLGICFGFILELVDFDFMLVCLLFVFLTLRVCYSCWIVLCVVCVLLILCLVLCCVVWLLLSMGVVWVGCLGCLFCELGLCCCLIGVLTLLLVMSSFWFVSQCGSGCYLCGVCFVVVLNVVLLLASLFVCSDAVVFLLFGGVCLLIVAGCMLFVRFTGVSVAVVYLFVYIGCLFGLFGIVL